jgi:hypothetical protein
MKFEVLPSTNLKPSETEKLKLVRLSVLDSCVLSFLPLHTILVLRDEYQMRTSRFLLVPKVPWGKAKWQSSKRDRWDVGAKSAADIGDTFTLKGHYANRSDPSLMLSSRTKIQQRLVAEQREREGGTIGSATFESDHPGAQRKWDQLNDEYDVALRGESLEPRHTKELSLALNRHERVAESRKLNVPLAPRDPKKLAGLERHLKVLETSDDQIAEMRDRLASEHGIFAPQRMDAYMLGDDSIFPSWVQSLSPSVQAQVKYGGLGLSLDDEVLKVNLGRLPVDRRRVEWERLRLARQYREGTDRPLSPQELKSAKMNARQNYFLRRKRQDRASTIAQLAVAKPSKYSAEAKVTKEIDLSSRMATIAQYVEAGIETKGQWPLSQADLAKAKLRKKREEIKLTFADAEAKRLLNNKKMDPLILNALQRLDEDPPVIKRISRREYQKRWTRVMGGHGDPMGHIWSKLRSEQDSRSPTLAVETAKQFALQKEVGAQTYYLQSSRRKIWTPTQSWPARAQQNAFNSEGGPSPGAGGWHRHRWFVE